MRKWVNVLIICVGALLIVNGLLNIIDDSRVMTFDITSLLAGLGLILVGGLK